MDFWIGVGEGTGVSQGSFELNGTGGNLSSGAAIVRDTRVHMSRPGFGEGAGLELHNKSLLLQIHNMALLVVYLLNLVQDQTQGLM